MSRPPRKDSREPDSSHVTSLLQRRSTDEYVPPPRAVRERAAVRRALERGADDAARVGRPLGDYWSERRGTAAGLLSLNEAFGERYYDVPAEAARDSEAAQEAFDDDAPVIDVQTHYVAERSLPAWRQGLLDTYRALQPDWWKGLEGFEAHDLAEYLRCVFLESETAVAVLTSAPGRSDDRMLFDREMAGTRVLLERLGGAGRLLNHSVVHPDVPGEIEAMEDARDRIRPVGWKVYTIGHMEGMGFVDRSDWWLDDEKTGVPFLERARELDVKLVCAHKGISAMVPTGSPRDVGPAARGFPDLDFVIYHAGYEMPLGEEPGEGPYTEATRDIGVNRLVSTLRDARLSPGANVYAELGSTWFCLIRRPDEAAHVLGKLLLACGEDNVLWGSDSIWYGPTQPAIDAFRAFQIPAELRERYGYPELTPAIKRKILGGNAARVYGIDAVAARAQRDELAWVRDALAEYERSGTPSL